MMERDKVRMDTCGLYSKYTAFAMEFLLFSMGCATFGGAIWVLVSEDVWTSMLDKPHLRRGAIILVAATIITVFTAVISMWGTLVDSKGAVVFSLFCSIVVFALMIAAGILGVVAKNHYPEELRAKMRESIDQYYGINQGSPYHDAITNTWDRIQDREECCGVEDETWSIYRNSVWFTAKSNGIMYVPQTCCRRNQYGQYADLNKCQTWTSGPPYQPGQSFNEALIYRGCLEVVQHFLQIKADFIIGVGFGIGLYVLIIIILLGIMAVRIPDSS